MAKQYNTTKQYATFNQRNMPKHPGDIFEKMLESAHMKLHELGVVEPSRSWVTFEKFQPLINKTAPYHDEHFLRYWCDRAHAEIGYWLWHNLVSHFGSDRKAENRAEEVMAKFSKEWA